MRRKKRMPTWSDIGSSIGSEELNSSIDTQSQDSEKAFTHHQGEKIFVSVRVRPLNEKELSRNEVFDWECINPDTIICKNTPQERSMYPTTYSFDKVFGIDSPTKKVYEEAAKDVALSVVSGINSSIFAYGQTSSGKTYTMCGVTEYAVEDIYDYIEKHDEREFILKFSAIEIYNEAVRDLLSTDSTPLRLLDDPERGTVVERLTEVVLSSKSHLLELLSICEAQRHIGETSLNETSSRSHQILRLTVESSTRTYLGLGCSSTLAATVNFIDLAGSERASQTLSAGMRLKEGSHINRSLLTLGTVIRKLSKGKSGHVPYRDSKLTRILQNSLGGNARTAIICTMSPARSHVEQSRNTLLFASSAKEVNTNAHVNVVMSDKALVKQLQKELARLESEMKIIGSTPISRDSTSLLREKELQIKKMDEEIKELTRQRDAAQYWIQNLQRPGDVQLVEKAEENFLLDESTPKFAGLDPGDYWENIGERKNIGYENVCKESKVDVQIANSEENIRRSSMTSDGNCEGVLEESNEKFGGKDADPEIRDKEVDEISTYETYDALKNKMQEMQNTINFLVAFYPLEQSPCSSERESSSCSSLTLPRSRSCKARFSYDTSPNWLENDPLRSARHTNMHQKLSKIKNAASNQKSSWKPCYHSFDSAEHHGFRDLHRENLSPTEGFHEKLSEQNCRPEIGNMSTKHSQTSLCSMESLNLQEFGGEDSVSNHGSTFTLMEMPECRSGKECFKTSVEEMVPSVVTHSQSVNGLFSNFGSQRREIIELWETCNAPLLHRTYFFLLFKGDPSDSVYMEVELRRLYFLKEKFSQETCTTTDNQMFTHASSLKALNRERGMLSKKIQKKLSRKEREGLYLKWEIDLKSRQRSLQLSHKIWSDTKDIEHVKNSASLVAKLVGIKEPCQVPKEIVGLSFLPQPITGWKSIVSRAL
ncbi:hypothetical protein ACFE04_026818 [Oxalis oulophora]